MAARFPLPPPEAAPVASAKHYCFPLLLPSVPGCPLPRPPAILAVSGLSMCQDFTVWKRVLRAQRRLSIGYVRETRLRYALVMMYAFAHFLVMRGRGEGLGIPGFRRPHTSLRLMKILICDRVEGKVGCLVLRREKVERDRLMSLDMS